MKSFLSEKIKKRFLIALISLFTLTAAYVAFDPPRAYTQFYGLRMWGLDDNPSADSLNQNWKDVDSLLNELIVFTDTSELVIQNDTLRFSETFIQSILDTGRLVIPESIDVADFNPVDGSTIPYRQGRTFYNRNTKAFTFYDDVNGVPVDLSQVVNVRIVNSDTDTLKKGMVCSYAGWNGKFAYAVQANAKIDTLSTILAVASHDIAPNDSGKLVVFGAVQNLNTSAYSQGDVIFVDTLDGQWTTSKPPGKYNQSPFGFILRSHATEGIIYTYTGLIPAVSPTTATTYVANASEIISTSTTPVQITNVGDNLFTLDDDVTYGISLSGDTLTIQRSGIYKVLTDFSFEGGSNMTYRLFFKINGVEDTKYQSTRKTGNADVGYFALQGRYSLNPGDKITLWVVSDASTTFTVKWSRWIVDQLR